VKKDLAQDEYRAAVRRCNRIRESEIRRHKFEERMRRLAYENAVNIARSVFMEETGS
jgi:hypothetical protein